jgi:sigma-B regulation protein RsbU (phosphoserine phosphatase)
VIGESTHGLPLAVTGNQEYRSATVQLEPGDMVVLYTDGINEALDRNANVFGIDSLVATLESAAPGPAAAGEAILIAVRAHVGNRARSDDITLICFGRDR